MSDPLPPDVNPLLQGYRRRKGVYGDPWVKVDGAASRSKGEVYNLLMRLSELVCTREVVIWEYDVRIATDDPEVTQTYMTKDIRPAGARW